MHHEIYLPVGHCFDIYDISIKYFMNTHTHTQKKKEFDVNTKISEACSMRVYFCK